jgi:hypothetical protein
MNQAGQEALQEIVSNAAVKTINEHQPILQGTADAFVGGLIGTAPFILLPAGGVATKLGYNAIAKRVGESEISVAEQHRILDKALEKIDDVLKKVKEEDIASEEVKDAIKKYTDVYASASEYAHEKLNLEQLNKVLNEAGIARNSAELDAIERLKESRDRLINRVNDLRENLQDKTRILTTDMISSPMFGADSPSVVNDLRQSPVAVSNMIDSLARQAIGSRSAEEIEKDQIALLKKSIELKRLLLKEYSDKNITLARMEELDKLVDILKEEYKLLEKEARNYYLATGDKVVLNRLEVARKNIEDARNAVLPYKIYRTGELGAERELLRLKRDIVEGLESQYSILYSSATSRFSNLLSGIDNQISDINNSINDLNRPEYVNIIFDIYDSIKKNDKAQLESNIDKLNNLLPESTDNISKLKKDVEEIIDENGKSVTENVREEIDKKLRDIELHQSEKDNAERIKNKSINPAIIEKLDKQSKELSETIEKKKVQLKEYVETLDDIQLQEIRELTEPVRKEESLVTEEKEIAEEETDAITEHYAREKIEEARREVTREKTTASDTKLADAFSPYMKRGIALDPSTGMFIEPVTTLYPDTIQQEDTIPDMFTGIDTQLETASEEALATQMQSLIEQQRINQNITDIVEETEPQTKPEPQPEPIPIPEPIPEPEQVKEEDKQKLMPRIPVGGEEEKESVKGKIKRGTITWRQGMFWYVLPPPYTKESMWYSKRPPAGVYRYATGKGSAEKTIQIIGGTATRDADIDIGIAIVHLKAKKDKISIDFSQDADDTYKGKSEDRIYNRELSQSIRRSNYIKRPNQDRIDLLEAEIANAKSMPEPVARIKKNSGDYYFGRRLPEPNIGVDL